MLYTLSGGGDHPEFPFKVVTVFCQNSVKVKQKHKRLIAAGRMWFVLTRLSGGGDHPEFPFKVVTVFYKVSRTNFNIMNLSNK